MTQEKPVSTPFYLLSPDGFTLTRDAEPYTSLDAAWKDFQDWKRQFESQGYYSSLRYGRIPLDELHEYMIESKYLQSLPPGNDQDLRICDNCACMDQSMVWSNSSDEIQCDNCGHSETE